MRGYTLARLLTTVAVACVVAALLYLTHPGWFENKSPFSLPPAASSSPTPGPVPVKRPTQPAEHCPTANQRNLSTRTTQHLDNVWITPYRVTRSSGFGSTMPNIGNEFLLVHLDIQNCSTSEYPVRLSDFEVLDGDGVLDPPTVESVTRQELREVRLIPEGFIRGALLFEVPATNHAVTLIYQPDPLDPSKRKEWPL